MVMRRDRNKGVKADKCCEKIEEDGRARNDLIKYAAEEGESKKHKWEIAPNIDILLCTRCGFYLTSVPAGSNISRSYANKECGVALAKPWFGITPHEWSWYEPPGP